MTTMMTDRHISTDASVEDGTPPYESQAVPSTATEPPADQMYVTKRNGSREPVDVNKIVRAISRCTRNLTSVSPIRVAQKTIGGLYDGATTLELDQLSIRTAAALTAEEPEYGNLAARLMAELIEKEVRHQDIQSFSQSIQRAHSHDIVNDRVLAFVTTNARKLNDAINLSNNDNFEYFGLRTVYDRYLLKHPTKRVVLETPQYFFMRVACALGGEDVNETLEIYRLFSSMEYLTSSPTLFNAGTQHEQLSSCFLLDSPQDDLSSIYGKYAEVAQLSKFAGGIGVSFNKIRARGSHIKGTNGHSNGIVPWLKTLDASVQAVNQGGKRKGAAAVYLETWHADIEEFLELRDNTGDHQRRTHNLNLANWTPDEFMRRVDNDELWSLFDPKVVPELHDSFGERFEELYRAAEAKGLYTKQIPARTLWMRMLKTLAETGNGWLTFKDRSNLTSNQTGAPGNVIHLSNLCTEILEVTSDGESAVCNLGSINLARHVCAPNPHNVSKIQVGVEPTSESIATTGLLFDFEKLAHTVRLAVRQLNRVIDLNFYPVPNAKTSNQKWRPIGLGVMGLQDVFFKLGLSFDDPKAKELSDQIAEHIYFHALKTSNELALEEGPHPNFADTRAAKGELQFDYWPNSVQTIDRASWEELRYAVKTTGLRNSLMIAIAPTATIASIVGCYECVEPQVSNLFKRETLSGDFLVINRYLVAELKQRGLWTADIRDQIKLAEGSIQGIEAIPEELRARFRTVWELSQKTLINLAVGRGAYIDQSQSLNLFMENPNIGQLSSMYMYAWKSGVKTTYYLRSRPATRIAKTTVSAVKVPAAEEPKVFTPEEALVCSLENPELCEACQ